MYFNKAICYIALSLGAFMVSSSPSMAQPAQATPETVLATFRVKPDRFSVYGTRDEVVSACTNGR
jgi:hypothetical protein